MKIDVRTASGVALGRRERPVRELPAWLHRNILSYIESAPAHNSTLLRAYNVALRLLGGRYRARTYFGSTMLCDPHDAIQNTVLHFGTWEPNISAVIEQLLSPGDICVDIGANVGYDTLLASHLVGPHGSVVAIEASPSIFDLLSRNIGENDARNIRLVQKAVSDGPGMLNLYAGPAGNRGLTTTLASPTSKIEATVEALPLDQILTVEERSRLRLIKMDIEGGEVPVMHRFLDTLELYPDFVTLIVEVAPCDEWPDIFQRMRAAGFSAYFIENSYNRQWYIKQRHQLTPLQRLDGVPNYQADILFTRGVAPVIAAQAHGSLQ
ncbi:MAG: FkbM family methyltransferase [Bradyrhizobium sp.]|uniref:FkbM family methyltransferase n=1 Tax=Bradyrhizobium sp. TaxID=376 RepID=UPI0025BAB196|nr:FkbM family methyltransferase [Bradyrhizobium sp.]MBI5265029.1 FkbM family methyltransferase [Bradyrhizobium sp.]